MHPYTQLILEQITIPVNRKYELSEEKRLQDDIYPTSLSSSEIIK